MYVIRIYLDYKARLLFFESILITFESSVIYWGIWGSIENWLKPKSEPPSGNLACQNQWNALYEQFSKDVNVRA